MSDAFATVFESLKPVLAKHAARLAVKADTAVEYTLETQAASPFPQHKGHPLFFGSIKVGKAYVSFHLLPLYMSPVLIGEISPELKKRMQGKACFNFKAVPDKETLSDLKRLTAASLKEWAAKKWL